MHETFGYIAAGTIFVSAIPYVARIYQRKITPNITTWALWSFLGIILLLTYNSAGAKESVLVTVPGVINPVAITILAFWKGTRKKLDGFEIACVICAIGAMILWMFMKSNPRTAQYALYLALVADLCAVWPTIRFLWHEPWEDRPFAWGMFALGSGINILAVKEPSVANYAFPVYMSVTGLVIMIIVTVYRIRKKIPIREWI